MVSSQHVSFDQLSQRIERGHRKALVRTFLLSFATVVVAAAFLVFTLRELERANQQLSKVNKEISDAIDAKEKAQAELKSAQDDLGSAVTQAKTLQEQVDALKAELAEAHNLSKHVYKLDLPELKMMSVEYGRAVEALEWIEKLKDQVHYTVSNTSTGGYSSPGFARLILQKLGRMRADSDLAILPQDGGPPNVGDIVVYESGFHLFYFRDHTRREFVVGMTPLGVVSLDYDFGAKRTAILRTGLSSK